MNGCERPTCRHVCAPGPFLVVKTVERPTSDGTRSTHWLALRGKVVLGSGLSVHAVLTAQSEAAALVVESLLARTEPLPGTVPAVCLVLDDLAGMGDVQLEGLPWDSRQW